MLTITKLPDAGDTNPEMKIVSVEKTGNGFWKVMGMTAAAVALVFFLSLEDLNAQCGVE